MLFSACRLLALLLFPVETGRIFFFQKQAEQIESGRRSDTGIAQSILSILKTKHPFQLWDFVSNEQLRSNLITEDYNTTKSEITTINTIKIDKNHLLHKRGTKIRQKMMK